MIIKANEAQKRIYRKRVAEEEHKANVKRNEERAAMRAKRALERPWTCPDCGAKVSGFEECSCGYWYSWDINPKGCGDE